MHTSSENICSICDICSINTHNIPIFIVLQYPYVYSIRNSGSIRLVHHTAHHILRTWILDRGHAFFTIFFTYS